MGSIQGPGSGTTDRKGALMTHWTTNQMKLRAHAVLDDVRAGLPRGTYAIKWALRILGDL